MKRALNVDNKNVFIYSLASVKSRLLNKARILIVEDELIIAMTFAKYLNSKGYATEIAINYDKAVEQLQACNFDIVLLDIKLRGVKSGIDVAAYINEHHQLPFVFVTSHMDSETIQGAKHTRPRGYITKPINKDTLFTTLEMIDLNRLPDNEYLVHKDGKDVYRIKQDDILYIQTNHVYVLIHVADKERPYQLRNTLHNILSLLNEKQFIQVHRSYAINIDKITAYNSNELTINDVIIPISKSKKDEVLNRLSQKMNIE